METHFDTEWQKYLAQCRISELKLDMHIINFTKAASGGVQGAETPQGNSGVGWSSKAPYPPGGAQDMGLREVRLIDTIRHYSDTAKH